MSRTAAITLAVVVAFLAGRESAVIEGRFLAAVSRPLFRIHARNVRAFDWRQRPLVIDCPRCSGWASSCLLCRGQGVAKVDQTDLAIRVVADGEPNDYRRQP